MCFHSRKSIQQAGDVVYVQFSDIRDACAIHASSRLTTEDWRLEFSHPKAFPKVSSRSHINTSPGLSCYTITDKLTMFQNDFAQQDCQINGLGQVQIVAVSERSSSVDVFQTIELVKNFLHPYGQLFAFIVLSTCQDGSFRAVAEFCNVNSAVTAAGGRRNRHVLNVSFPRRTTRHEAQVVRTELLLDTRVFMSRYRSVILTHCPHLRLPGHSRR